MTRIDFGGAILALLTGFILSAGIVGFVLSAGGFQVSMLTPPRPVIGPGAAPAVAAPAPAVKTQAGPAVEVKVVATDLKFTPPTLQAKVGQPVKVVLENKGMIEHDISFPTMKADKAAASLHAVAGASKSATLEFTPTAKGSYEYICTIPGHKEAGMKGVINVTD